MRVRKTTLGSAGGPFTFAIGDLPELTATTTAPGQTVVAGDFDDVLGDSATLTETFPPGDGILWEATSAVCNGDPATAIEPPPSGDAAWTVPVDPGATVDCTITNTGRPQGAITVQKTTQGAVGTFDYIVTPVPGPLTRTLPLAQAATTTAEGVPVTAVGDPLTDLPYGRYLITEIGPPGTDEGRWLLQGATCGLGAPRDRPTVGVEITLTPQNPTATCSFRNQFELLPPVRPASRFVALTPNRILDTRTQNGQVGYSGDKPGPNQAFDLQVAGRGGVPAEDVTAVVMTVTSTEPDTEGYITVWPAGEPQPTISNLNTRPQPSVPLGQQAMPNLVTVPLGSTGRCRSSARPRPTSWPTWPASTRRCRCRPRAGTSRSARPSGCSTPAR